MWQLVELKWSDLLEQSSLRLASTAYFGAVYTCFWYHLANVSLVCYLELRWGVGKKLKKKGSFVVEIQGVILFGRWKEYEELGMMNH
jgi:hypothetical protein